MTIFYLVTTFVVLLAGAKVADKAISGAQHLPDQGVASSREGWLAGQRSRGLGCDVRVVDVWEVQSHLIAKPTKLIEQGFSAPHGTNSLIRKTQRLVWYTLSLFS
jgi:hypothetical protein